MGLQRGRQAGEYAKMKEGVESTQHKCQTPTARGQAGVDLGVNQQALARQQDVALLGIDSKTDLTERVVKR